MNEREILVGLNEGPSSRAALRWAAGLARRTGGTVRAVHALSWPFGPDGATSAVPDGSHEALDVRYRAEIDKAFWEVAPRPNWILQFADAIPVQCSYASPRTRLRWCSVLQSMSALVVW